MGFLHKLWDETVAGPTPETGLARLRKYGSFSAESGQSLQVAEDADRVRVSRSITIAKNNQKPNPTTLKNLTVDDVAVSGPDSPSSSAATTPRTPLTLTPGTPVFRRWRSMKLPGAADMSDGTEHRTVKQNDRTNLTEKEESHLMIVMSALDR